LPKKTKLMAISSSSSEGVKEVLRELAKATESAAKAASRKQASDGVPVIGLREDDQDWKLEKVEDQFFITGRKVEKFARRTRFDDYHGQQRLRDIMRKMGIMHELTRRGAEPGMPIIIGRPEIGRIKY
jgi:GTP-binding protein